MQQFVVTLHVAVLFVAFALSFGTELMLHRVAGTGDVRAIRTVFGAARPLGRVTPLVFLLGVALGFVAVFTGHFDPLRPWLVLSYVVYVAMAAITAIVGRGWQQAVLTSAAASPDGAPSAALRASLAAPRGWITLWAILVGIVAMTALMVMKPGGR